TINEIEDVGSKLFYEAHHKEAKLSEEKLSYVHLGKLGFSFHFETKPQP
ncbi:1506_t:CDS:2, partial [Diversispora eburnea]